MTLTRRGFLAQIAALAATVALPPLPSDLLTPVEPFRGSIFDVIAHLSPIDTPFAAMLTEMGQIADAPVYEWALT